MYQKTKLAKKTQKKTKTHTQQVSSDGNIM